MKNLNTNRIKSCSSCCHSEEAEARDNNALSSHHLSTRMVGLPFLGTEFYPIQTLSRVCRMHHCYMRIEAIAHGSYQWRWPEKMIQTGSLSPATFSHYFKISAVNNFKVEQTRRDRWDGRKISNEGSVFLNDIAVPSVDCVSDNDIAVNPSSKICGHELDDRCTCCVVIMKDI